MLALLLIVPLAIVGNSEAVITSSKIGEKLRLFQPTFIMVEELMQTRDTHLCSEKMYCLIETSLPHDGHNPLTYYSRFLTNTQGDFDAVAFREVEALTRKFPKLTKLVDSIKYGQHANSSQQCSLRYPECTMTEQQILTAVTAFSDESIAKYGFSPHNLAKRADGCWWGGLGCATVGGACALCAEATVGLCAAACSPYVGAACSGFGLGCLFG